MDRKGKVHVVTGDGKGKTTSALGLVLSAVYQGMRVLVVQFLKPPESSGEHFAAPALNPLLTMKPVGRKGFFVQREEGSPDRIMAENAFVEARSEMLDGTYDMIVLDEINVAVYMGLLDIEDVLNFIQAKPENLDLVMTGRYADPRIIERADSVLEMVLVKHHFDRGIPAIEGIEY
jgi:cob(I)alamin adenosyltransferase